MLIPRIMTAVLLKDAAKASVIGILGPRQSGKTTIAPQTFSKHTYISLENLDTRAFAQNDPRSFLAFHQNKL